MANYISSSKYREYPIFWQIYVMPNGSLSLCSVSIGQIMSATSPFYRYYQYVPNNNVAIYFKIPCLEDGIGRAFVNDTAVLDSVLQDIEGVYIVRGVVYYSVDSSLVRTKRC